jgi:hypothetical protein
VSDQISIMYRSRKYEANICMYVSWDSQGTLVLMR